MNIEEYTKIGSYYFLTSDLEQSLKTRCSYVHESEVEE